MNIEKIARALAMANGHPEPEAYVERVKEIYEQNDVAESEAIKADALDKQKAKK